MLRRTVRHSFANRVRTLLVSVTALNLAGVEAVSALQLAGTWRALLARHAVVEAAEVLAILLRTIWLILGSRPEWIGFAALPDDWIAAGRPGGRRREEAARREGLQQQRAAALCCHSELTRRHRRLLTDNGAAAAAREQRVRADDQRGCDESSQHPLFGD